MQIVPVLNMRETAVFHLLVYLLDRTRFEHARLQLVALSTSPEDEEYFLSSRRFWSKKELEVGENRGSSSGPISQSQRRLQTLPRWRGGRYRGSLGVALARSVSTGAVDVRTGQRRISRRIACTGRARGNVCRHGRRSHSAVYHRLRSGNRHESGDTDRTIGDGGCVGENREGELDRDRGDTRLRTTPGNADSKRNPDSAETQRLSVANHGSAALACITSADIEQLLLEVKPTNATTVVCAAVVFLLSSDDKVPADFRWPQGFAAVARRADDFLANLREKSGKVVSPFKAQVLQFVLQREDIMPMAIERQGGHTVARCVVRCGAVDVSYFLSTTADLHMSAVLTASDKYTCETFLGI